VATAGVIGKEFSMSIYSKHLVVGLAFALTICAFGFVIGYTEKRGGIEGWNDPRLRYPGIKAVGIAASSRSHSFIFGWSNGVLECWSNVIID
jgi:hypothetical protein